MPLPTPADSHTRLYDSTGGVDTPAVLVDLDTMEANVRRYADFAEDPGVRLRSHVKTPALAHYQDRIVVDAGSKSICPDVDLSPMAVGYEGLDYFTASEEHGWVDTGDCEATFAVGDRIEWIPPHVCTTVDLHDTLVGTRDGRVEEVWNVRARGKVR